MPSEQIFDMQQGVWIDAQWIKDAGLGSRLRVIVEPGEIRIVPAVSENTLAEDAWHVLLALGEDAPSGRLTDSSTKHDDYLYGRQ